MIVLVTGLMRTGTSLVSKILHHFGVPMGTYMRFPLSTRMSQVDWEDVVFTDFMLQSVQERRGFSERRDFFKQYADSREGEIWGVKSPFALPYVQEFKDAVGEEVKVIKTTRDYAQTLNSLRTQLESPILVAIQEVLSSSSEFEADLEVPIERLWHRIHEVELEIKDLLRS